MSIIPALGRLKQEDEEFEASLNYMVRAYLKQTNKQNNFKSPNREAGDVAQAVEYLPRKCKALSSNPSTTTTKKKKWK
jgi:hypothetical protein